MWSPFTDWSALTREIENLFGGVMWGAPRTTGAAYLPRTAVEDTGDGWLVHADLPGIDPDSLEVEAEGGRLVIRARRDVSAPEGYAVQRQERSSFNFQKTFTLPDVVDLDHVEARLENGVLQMHLPRAPEAQPRRITVSA